MTHLLLAIWMSASIFPGHSPLQDCTLVIRIDRLESMQGVIRLGIYDNAAAFSAQQGAQVEKNIPVTGSLPLEITITGLKPGHYAVGGYQDTNSNDKLDTNVLGIPKEPYGFSRNPKAKWGAPTFEETVIALKPGRNEVVIEMKPWGKR